MGGGLGRTLSEAVDCSAECLGNKEFRKGFKGMFNEFCADCTGVLRTSSEMFFRDSAGLLGAWNGFMRLLKAQGVLGSAMVAYGLGILRLRSSGCESRACPLQDQNMEAGIVPQYLLMALIELYWNIPPKLFSQPMGFWESLACWVQVLGSAGKRRAPRIRWSGKELRRGMRVPGLEFIGFFSVFIYLHFVFKGLIPKP